MKKVLSRKFVIFCLVASMLLVAPFHIINAEGESVDYDDVIEGVYYSEGVTSPKMFTWVFSEPVVGYFEPDIKYKTSNNSSTVTRTPTVYVNGTTANYLLSVGTDIIVQSVTNSFDMLSSGSISSQYYFPYESLNFIVETAGRGYKQVDLYNLGKWTIPVFEVPANGEITHKYLYSSGDNSTMTIVLWINKSASSVSNFANYFDITNGELVELIPLNVFAYNGTNNTRLIKVVIKNNTTSTNNVYLYAKTKCLIMPIYAHSNREMGYETKDFCDNFGLPYVGLTSEQEQSASDLQNEQSEFNNSADDLYQYENGFNESMNDSLDDINVNFDVGNTLGSKFLASASWVRTQFESLTSNTPFGSVLSFSLILGIALLIIGKVLK